MISIVGKRGTGKTEKMFKAARDSNSLILTANSRAMKEKAKAKGYEDLEIIGFGDLKNDNYSFAKTVMVDNADYVLSVLLDKYYGLKMGGYTLTVENGKEKK